MQDHKLSKPLKHKIKQALEYHSAKSIFSHTDKNEILNEIPVELKFQIATSLISNMKTHIPFFSKKDKVFMANFIPLLTPLSVAAREFVYRKSEYPYLCDYMHIIFLYIFIIYSLYSTHWTNQLH